MSKQCPICAKPMKHVYTGESKTIHPPIHLTAWICEGGHRFRGEDQGYPWSMRLDSGLKIPSHIEIQGDSGEEVKHFITMPDGTMRLI